MQLWLVLIMVGSGLTKASRKNRDLFFSIALSDAGFFNALMLTTAIVRDMILLKASFLSSSPALQEPLFTSRETMYYKALTLRLAQQQFQKGQVSIALIAGLATAAVSMTRIRLI
jgi:hypothetical protein